MQPVFSYRCSPITGLSYFTFYIQSLFGELGRQRMILSDLVQLSIQSLPNTDTYTPLTIHLSTKHFIHRPFFTRNLSAVRYSSS